MSCFWFGHRLPVQTVLVASLPFATFQCARCKKNVRWEKMPKAVRAMRDEYLRRKAS